MGNLMSSEATPSEVKKYGVSDATINEDKMLVDKILRKAKEMYDQNYKSFLNEDFCNNVFVAYSKKLYELPIKKNVIEGAYKQINSDSGDDFKLIIKSRSLDDEKYLISELSGRIVEHFANNKYVSSVMHEGLQLSFPDIAYIQDKALMLLEHMDKIEKQRQVGGKSRRKHPLFLDTEGGAPFGNNENNSNNENNNENNNNENNENNNVNANANANANANSNANTVINNKRQNNSNYEVNNSKPIKANFSERPKQEYPPEGLTKKQKKEWRRKQYREQREQREQREKNNPNININSEIERIIKENNIGPIVKNSKNNGNNRKENSEENNIFKSFNIGPAPAPVTAPIPDFPKKEPIKFSNNRIGLSNLLKTSNKPQPQQPQQPFQKSQQQPFQPRQLFQKPHQQPFQKPPYPQKPLQPQQQQQFLKKDSFYTGRMSNEELRRRKDIESSGDRHCTDEALECRLTKKQMCEKITYHFIVVNNLIATIVSVVPFPNESGDKYAGGFMFDRMDSLRSGKFCLPPHHSEISSISDDERLHKIFKYINILPKDNVSFEETCKRSGGFVLKLSKERMEELGRDEKFGRSYYDFFRKINLFYQEALINLYNILESLQNNTSISTRRLNELSARTKQIIDELYLKTQFNYLMAILVILDFDFAKNTKETKAKEDRMTFVKSKRII